MPGYQVLIDDNFHCMDESERVEHGVFETSAEAIAACQRIVEESLSQLHRTGMTAAQLYEAYVTFGDDPFVVCNDGDDRIDFSAWDFAKQRSELLARRDETQGDSPLA